MTLDEMEAAGRKAANIKAAMTRLAEAQRQLDLLKQHVEQRKDWSVDMSWKPDLILWKAPQHSYSRDITIKVDLPFAVVQQQLVYAVQKARREVIALGGLA